MIFRIGSAPKVSENVITKALQDACRKLVHMNNGLSFQGTEDEILKEDAMLITIEVYHRAGVKRLAQEIVFYEGEYLQDICALIAASCSNPDFKHERGEEFLFVGNVFYANKAAILHASYLRNWIKISSHASMKTDIHAIRLETAKFSNLINLLVQVPYLYCHGESCEHVFMVKNIQRIHPLIDSKMLSDYPMVTFQARAHRYKCMICKNMYARYVCENCPYSGEIYSFYCGTCIQILYYSPNGNVLCTNLPRNLKIRQFSYH